MGEYIAKAVIISGKKKFLPNEKITLDNKAGAALLAKGMIEAAPAKAGKQAAPKDAEPSPAVLDAAARVDDARTAFDAAKIALETATPQQKGVRTAAHNKALAELNAAEEALAALTAE